MLIVLDGIDGSGKTTQTNILIKRLKKEKKPVVTLDFPQYTQNFFGGMVKQFLNGDFGDINTVDPHLAALTYALDRWESKSKLEEWLKEKKIVILNRYSTANLIHQTSKLPPSKQKAFMSWLEKMEFEYLKIPQPDHVLYLYLPYTLSYGLINKRGNKKDIHESNLAHLKKAASQGLKLATSRKNWHLIKCNKGDTVLSREVIAKRIWEVVSSVIE